MLYYAQKDAIFGTQDYPELQDTYNHYQIGNIVFVYSDRYDVFMNHYESSGFHQKMRPEKMPEKAFVYHEELFDYIFDTKGHYRTKAFES